MRPVCTYTDFFVIATGQNPRQTAAIYEQVREQLKHEHGLIPHNAAGAAEANWMFYKLEELWGDVPTIDVEAVAV